LSGVRNPVGKKPGFDPRNPVGEKPGFSGGKKPGFEWGKTGFRPWAKNWVSGRDLVAPPETGFF